MIVEAFKKYEEQILSKLRLEYCGLIWCELGNQRYCGKPAKGMYELKGVKHTSIDINGLGGAVPIDLDSPIPSNMENKFDVVTNYGTSDHVNNQYSVFKNVHLMCKLNGIMLHGVPLIGNWVKHCRYYYSKQFFEGLSIKCGYRIIDLKVLNSGFYRHPKNLVVGVLQRVENVAFVSQRQFIGISGINDSKNLNRTGNYSIKRK